MAGNPADLLDHQQHDVIVAVQPDFAYPLRMTGFFTLAPQPAARARKINRLTGGRRLGQRLAVHPREHEDAAGPVILRDGGHQTFDIPGDGVEPRLAHSRTSVPRAAMSAFAWPTVYSPKWKMLAASTASAPPCCTPSARCSSVPTPPLAITGISTASDTARVNARSKPSRVPSRSMLVSRISPAPSAWTSRAHSTASMPVALRPPCVKTSQRSPCRLASMATTMHCEP